MPDQDRGVRFLHTLNQDQEARVRCPSCPGYRVTYQADCVCCGREVAFLDSKADVHLVKTCLSVKSEVVEVAMPKSASQAVPPVKHLAFKGPRTCKGRQRLSPISVLRNVSSFQGPHGGRETGIGSRVLLPAGSRNSIRILQQSTHNAVLQSSSRRTTYATRGRSTMRVGAHQDFKGVRTRRGVKGFLVEIRPPKWKKTIWLGTYNTDVEAAGAFDAGVFYTNKPNTKYNFRALEAAFPPLPSHLSLDQPDNMEEIKYFVQKQAKLAAAAARQMCINDINISGSTQPHHQELQEVKAVLLAFAGQVTAKVNNSTSNSESCLTDGSVSENTDTDLPTTPDAEYDGGFLDIIPMDSLDYLRGALPAVDEEAAENWIAEYTNYLNTQPAEGPMSLRG